MTIDHSHISNLITEFTFGFVAKGIYQGEILSKFTRKDINCQNQIKGWLQRYIKSGKIGLSQRLQNIISGEFQLSIDKILNRQPIQWRFFVNDTSAEASFREI